MPNRDFTVWAKFPRFDANGNRIRANKHLLLIVAGLEIRKAGMWQGKLSFSDGTETAYFPIRKWRPSWLARTALNYESFVHAQEADR